MLYHYLAADKTGKIVEADFDGENLGQVLQYIASNELRPISVKPVQQTQGGVHRLFGGINLADKVFLTKYLSLMLKVGTDLLSAINILIADFDKPAMRNFLLEVRDNLSHGQQFYISFAKHPDIFSPVFVNLIKAAEMSGNLEHTFETLSVSLRKEAQLREQVRAALIYPIILLCTSLLVFIFLVTFALPRIAKVFDESGINPPLFSRIVFGIGLFVNDHIVLIGSILLVGAVSGGYFFFKNPVGRRLADHAMGKIPLLRNIYRDLAIQRFASTFSALMKAGLPIIQTTKITADVVGSEEFKLSLIRIADEGLAKGLTIGEAFRRETVFPKVVTNLVSISERAGHLEEVLETVSEFYASNVDANIKGLTAFLEPLLLLTMGFLVSSIAISIVVPIYQLTTQF